MEKGEKQWADQPGIFRGKNGWEVDKVVEGDRFRYSGAASAGEAESWLAAELERRRAPPAESVPTFDQAAAHYVGEHQDKVSLELDVYLLRLVMPFIGQRPLDKIHDAALKPFVKAMQTSEGRRYKRPLKAKTINLALDRVRRILNLAARSWRTAFWPSAAYHYAG